MNLKKKRISTNRVNDHQSAFRITLLYLLFAGLWILLSDTLLDRLLQDGNLISRYQTYKGWLFVAVSGSLLYALLRHESSARKAAEREMRLWGDAFKHTQVGLAVGEAEGYLLSRVNPAFAEMHGYEPDELMNVPIVQVFAADQRQSLAGHIRLAHENGHHVFESWHVRKDGSVFPALVDVTTVKDEQGVVQYRIASVYNITERKRDEEKIQRQVQRLNSLRAIDNTITSTLDSRVVMNVLLDQVMEQLKVDAAAVLLYNPTRHSLDYAASRGFCDPEIQKSSQRIGSGLAGLVSEKREPVVYPDLEDKSEIIQRDYLIEKENFKAYFGAPLIAKDEIKGVLETFHRSTLTPDDEWMSFLEALAGQAAIALDNMSLYDRIQRFSQELRLAYDATLQGWAKALELRDRETRGHTDRVTDLTIKLAEALGFFTEELIDIRRGTLLHDIGKMAVPDHILFKPGPLSSDEWTIMRRHPTDAFELLAPIRFLHSSLDIPYCHHERWDGSGYPRGLEGEQIPLAARIFSVVDVWDALLSDRPYRKAWHEERVRRYLRERAGILFDPRVVEVFLQMQEV